FDMLQGCRVIDLTTIVLGPYATQILGDMGADVIKVEPPSGDLFRNSSTSRTPGMAPGFMNCNRNKRSIALDLKSEGGHAVMIDLIKSADVFVHNMRPQAAARLGLSYQDLKSVNPKLIYCTGPGYGQSGPYADYPAYDDVIQAATGIGRLNATDEGEPQFFPTVVCDKIAGLHLSLAVLGGLAKRQSSDEGCYIETPMFESVLSFLYVEHLDALTFRPETGDSGYARVLSPYRKPYKTKDDYIAVLPYNGQHWKKFFILADREDLANADWIQNPTSRSQNIGKLYGTLAEIMMERTTVEWLSELKRLEIPCSPVNDLDGLLNDPHLNETGFFQEVDHPTEGEIRTIRSPFLVEDVQTTDDKPAPKIGQHSLEILQELGIEKDQISLLFENGAVSETS
ncbi:MAG: CoA transferase, partial [Rhodospirillales bacterium]|nr:CoA transferase [Rhodospirillales bacterium]